MALLADGVITVLAAQDIELFNHGGFQPGGKQTGSRLNLALISFRNIGLTFAH